MIVSEDIKRETDPSIETSNDIFRNHPEAAFWVGRVASLGIVPPEMTEYMDALGRLRARVYVDECRFLGDDSIDALGREIDKYDERSVHFAVVENANEDSRSSRMIGSLRLITKKEPEEKYPIEEYFPEVFGAPVGVSSAEVSRFISRYPEDKFTKHVVSLSLIRAALLHAAYENIEDYYCIIEEPLFKLLGKIGISMELMGDSKLIPEQGGVLLPIKIDPLKAIKSVTTDKTGNILLEDFFKDEFDNNGLGYYPATFTGGINE